MAGGPLISQNAYFATIGTFFCLAIAVAIARITLRIIKFRRVYADDYFLFLALAALISSNALFFAAVPQLYVFAGFTTGQTSLSKDFFQTVTSTAVFACAAQIISWITIFAVKLSFLFYFRNLVDRLPNLTLWWRVTLAVTIPVAVLSMCSTFIVCPYTGTDILSHCVTDPGFLHRERIIIAYSVVSDIVTDAMIVSIPICLLRQTHLKIRRKVSIGILLCLSMAMIAIALVRGISAGVYGTHDQIWSSFWVQLETSISIIMISAMLFKSLLFVKKDDPTSDKNSPRLRTVRWRRKQPSQLPDVEIGATMTGMRTMIRENGRTTMGSFGKDESQLTMDSDRWRSSNDDSTLADGNRL